MLVLINNYRVSFSFKPDYRGPIEQSGDLVGSSPSRCNLPTSHLYLRVWREGVACFAVITVLVSLLALEAAWREDAFDI